jgi:hypothetical protein
LWDIGKAMNASPVRDHFNLANVELGGVGFPPEFEDSIYILQWTRTDSR